MKTNPFVGRSEDRIKTSPYGKRRERVPRLKLYLTLYGFHLCEPPLVKAADIRGVARYDMTFKTEGKTNN